MNEPIKRLYGLSVDGSKVRFVRRGEQHSIDLPDPGLAYALPFLQTRMPIENVARVTGTTSQALLSLKSQLAGEGLLAEQPSTQISSKDFAARFREALTDWMREAFSSPYWELMTSGRGSKKLYIGYLFELYHYTKNANRHMPMVVAHCPSHWKEVKRLLAVHYFEEWNHYDFFADALVAMGIDRKDVEISEPLPSTLEMSNFMRQAARTSPLCYAICSAILEGTTEDSGSYGEYFSSIAKLYDIPHEAIQPLFDHLALDADYNHKSLFEDICEHIGALSANEAADAMSFGVQMVDHIYMWTDHIQRYYGRSDTPRARRAFDINVN